MKSTIEFKGHSNSKLLLTYCEEGFSVIGYALYQDRAIKSEAFSVPGALIFNLTQIMAFLKQPCHSYTCTHKKQRIADAGYCLLSRYTYTIHTRFYW